MDDTYTLTTSVETNASKDEIWNAWTNADKVAKWWGPEGFTSSVEELGVKVGGKLRLIMHGPDGTDYPNLYVFDEVEYPNLIIYTNQGSEQFNLKPFQSVINLEENNGKTKITLKMRFASAEEQDKHEIQFHAKDGSRQLLERLAHQAEES